MLVSDLATSLEQGLRRSSGAAVAFKISQAVPSIGKGGQTSNDVMNEWALACFAASSI